MGSWLGQTERAASASAEGRSDYGGMVGPTEGAKAKRAPFASTATNPALAFGRPLEWKEMCSVVKTVALEVLGEKPKRRQTPWFQGHERGT
eukprot:1722951-Pyramimonas_sp.AAC.1